MMNTQQKFFHTMDNSGTINQQGMILDVDQEAVTVQFFSWIDGLPNGQKTFDLATIKTWRFYKSKAAWLNAGNGVFA